LVWDKLLVCFLFSSTLRLVTAVALVPSNIPVGKPFTFQARGTRKRRLGDRRRSNKNVRIRALEKGNP
jgi:hypothetical protein